MTSSSILSLVTFIYGLAAFLYTVAWIFRNQTSGKLATWTAVVGLAGNTAGIILRWVESYRLGIGHAPLSNLYESLIFFAWTIVLLYLYIERKYKFGVMVPLPRRWPFWPWPMPHYLPISATVSSHCCRL